MYTTIERIWRHFTMTGNVLIIYHYVWNHLLAILLNLISGSYWLKRCNCCYCWHSCLFLKFRSFPLCRRFQLDECLTCQPCVFSEWIISACFFRFLNVFDLYLFFVCSRLRQSIYIGLKQIQIYESSPGGGKICPSDGGKIVHNNFCLCQCQCYFVLRAACLY
jgi:hypothetical protein